MEEWKEVKGFPGYEVSSLGNVRSLSFNRTGTPGLLTPIANTSGYFQVSLKGKFLCVHRLVAEAFLPNPDGLPEADHLDRNKSNNAVSNLQWKTLSANRINVPARGRSGEKNIKQRSDGYEVVFQRNRQIVYNKWFKTLEEAINARDAFLQSVS